MARERVRRLVRIILPPGTPIHRAWLCRSPVTYHEVRSLFASRQAGASTPQLGNLILNSLLTQSFRRGGPIPQNGKFPPFLDKAPNSGYGPVSARCPPACGVGPLRPKGSRKNNFEAPRAPRRNSIKERGGRIHWCIVIVHGDVPSPLPAPVNRAGPLPVSADSGLRPESRTPPSAARGIGRGRQISHFRAPPERLQMYLTDERRYGPGWIGGRMPKLFLREP
jgi:hypothetical protein